MALTDIAVRQLKPADKPFKVGDERGLYLLINPQGGKLWRWKYRYLGKEKLMALGGYPDVSLAQARDKRDAARRLLAAGGDPMGERHAAKVAQRVAMEDSFEAVARKWWETWKGARSDRHADYVLRRLESDVFPAIGQRPISAIAATELVVMVKRIEARGALDIAKRSLQTCGQVFRYAIAHGKAARNPATDVRPSDVLPSRKKSNYARLDSSELPELLRKIEVYQGAAIICRSVRSKTRPRASASSSWPMSGDAFATRSREDRSGARVHVPSFHRLGAGPGSAMNWLPFLCTYGSSRTCCV